MRTAWLVCFVLGACVDPDPSDGEPSPDPGTEVDTGSDSQPCEDRDADGYEAASCGGEDCNDADAAVHPGAVEVCDLVDQDCDGLLTDAPAPDSPFLVDEDGDGFGSGDPQMGYCPGVIASEGGDCNDQDATVHPDAIEACDNRDTNCDGFVDNVPPGTPGRMMGWMDLDLDGVGATAQEGTFVCDTTSGFVDASGDCDDGNPDIHPGASEACNGLDDDCDGDVDEGMPGNYWYVDDDNDGYGTGEVVLGGCLPMPGQTGNLGDGPPSPPGDEESCDAIPVQERVAVPRFCIMTSVPWAEPADHRHRDVTYTYTGLVKDPAEYAPILMHSDGWTAPTDGWTAPSDGCSSFAYHHVRFKTGDGVTVDVRSDVPRPTWAQLGTGQQVAVSVRKQPFPEELWVERPSAAYADMDGVLMAYDAGAGGPTILSFGLHPTLVCSRYQDGPHNSFWRTGMHAFGGWIVRPQHSRTVALPAGVFSVSSTGHREEYDGDWVYYNSSWRAVRLPPWGAPVDPGPTEP